MTSERFCPRLPLDPFAAIDQNIPWSIPQNLPLSHPQIILILGEPPIRDLIPLLSSTHLSRSLVLIATHTPPLIPADTRGPALRILKLSQPLAIHDAGALRLVSLFERAQRVALFWLRDSSPHVSQLAQPSPNGDFSIIEPISYATNEFKRYPSPAPSVSESVSSKRRSVMSHQSTSPHRKFLCTKLPQKNSNDKVNFDAIINFLPFNLPDKALLKHAILVTTLSAQFLAPPTYISTTASYSPTTPQSFSSFPSHSYSSASQTVSSPSSGCTSDTSPCSSPLHRRLSKSWASPTSTSRAKNRLSLLFRATPPQPGSEIWLPEASDINETTEEPWKMTNAHLVHVLPMGWSPDSGAEFDRRASSSSSSSRLAGPSRQPNLSGYFKTPGGIGKPKLVQSIEQFLLSFAYPLGSLVSGNFSSGLGSGSARSDAASSNRSTKSVRPSSTNINEEHVTSARRRPTSTLGLIGNAQTYEQENSLLRASTLPATSIPSNINTPVKPAPYLLAPGIFSRCVGGPNVRSTRHSMPSSGCVVVEEEEEELERDEEENNRGDAYTDPEAAALTIGEIILLGALDFDHTRPGTGPGSGRAWIGNVGDVIIEVGASPDPGSCSSKGKDKGRAVDTEMTKTTKRTVNFGLSTPPDSLSSSNSTENVEEEQEEMTSNVGHFQMHARPPSQLDNIGNFDWNDHARTSSGAWGEKKVGFNEGVEALVMSPTSTSSTATKSKAAGASNITSTLPSTSTPTSNSPSLPKPTSQPATVDGNQNITLNTKSKLSKQKPSSSSISTCTPTSPSNILNSNNTSDKAKDKKDSNRISDSLSSLLAPSLPPLIVHRDRAHTLRGSGSVSGSSDMTKIPLQTQGHKAQSLRKGFVGALRKLWK